MNLSGKCEHYCRQSALTNLNDVLVIFPKMVSSGNDVPSERLHSFSIHSVCHIMLLSYSVNCSEEKCMSPPDGCSDIIPYTSQNNTLFELETEEDFKNFSMSLHMALENCTMDKDVARWGACNMMYPRCLMGWERQFCKWSCLGEQ